MTTATPTRPASRNLPTPPPNLPEAVSKAPTPIAKAAAEFLELRTRAIEAAASLREIERRGGAADQADREAIADALREGKSDPGAQNAEAYQAQLDAAVREAQGLADAAYAAWSDFLAALAEHGPAGWRTSLTGLSAKQASKASKALDVANAAADELAETRATLRWLTKALATIDGEKIAGTHPRRFPTPPQAMTSISVGGMPRDVRWALDCVQGWLDGGEES